MDKDADYISSDTQDLEETLFDEAAFDVAFADDEDLEPYSPSRWRHTAVPLLAVAVLAAFVLWSAQWFGPLIPRRDEQGRSLTAEGESIPRDPKRVLQGEMWNVTYEFWFDGDIRTLKVQIPQADYTASKARPETMEVLGSESRDAWTRRYYERPMSWPEQQRAVQSALGPLRALRSQLGLSSDDYVRMLNAFVGAMPYDWDQIRNDISVKLYPTTLLVDGKGVCEDKSMLLGAMLAAEGYETALVLLEEDDHMAVGVRSDTRSYKRTPYVFIDATGKTVRGQSREYQWPVDVGKPSKAYTSKPRVVALTRGGTRFGGD